jgi:hypothetical protein
MTFHNNQFTWTFGTHDLFSAKTVINCSLHINLIASANVPPQGNNSFYSSMIKCKWGKTVCFEISFIIPLAFEMQMERRCHPIVTLPSHLHKKSLGDTSLVP